MLDLAAIPIDQLRGMAQSAIGQSDYVGAERVLRAMVSRMPRDVESHLQLIEAIRSQGLRMEVLTCSRRLLGVAPRDWRAHASLASAQAAVGQLEASVRSYRKALELAPDNPGVMTDLAIALERLRQLDESKALALRAIELDPACVPAIGLVGQIAMVRGDHEEAEKWLNRSITEARSIDARAVGWHRLGALRETQKRWDEAFQCHDRANRAMLSTPAARHMFATPVFDHLPHQFRDGCEATLARWADHRFADALPDPVILCGFPRSGTTMTENVLAAIPGTITSDEEPVLAGAALLATELTGNPAAADTMAALDVLTDDQLTRLRSEYWKSACRLVSPDAARAKLFVDKTPLRFAHALLLNRIFPRAKMIFVVRDPRDCCLSCFFQDFAVSPTLVKFLTLETTGDTYAQVMTFWMRARTRVTMPVLEVRYEDMVADFEAHARRLVEFVGRPWSDDVLRFHEKAAGRAIRTPSFRAVTETVNTRAVGKWARYETHMGPLIERVRPFLDPLGYEE